MTVPAVCIDLRLASTAYVIIVSKRVTEQNGVFGEASVGGCKFKHHELLHDSNCGSFEQSTAQGRTQGVSNTHGTATVGASSSNVPSYSVTTCMSVVFLNIVPVRITCGDKEVVTTAFLDQVSSTSRCDSRLLPQLQFQGEKVSFSLTTVNKVKEKRHVFKVSTVLHLMMEVKRWNCLMFLLTVYQSHVTRR